MVTVADARGLSYYADHTLCRRLAMDECDLVRYRQQLIDLGLVAYRKPGYFTEAASPTKDTLSVH